MMHGPYELVPANPAIDMWALGVLLFLLCTGMHITLGALLLLLLRP